MPPAFHFAGAEVLPGSGLGNRSSLRSSRSVPTGACPACGHAEGLRRQLLPEQEQQLQIIQLRSGSCTNAQITAACPDAEVLIAEPNNRLDAQLIALLPKLKLIHGVGVGYNLFDLEEARQAGMKDGAFIVNTARGDLVDSAALAKALCSGKIAGAGLDTIAPEPVTTENPLLSLPHDRRGDHGGAKRTAAGKYRERVIIKSKTKTPLQLKWKSCGGVFACTATAHMGGCYCLFLAGGSGFMASSAVPSSFG